jgi:hypothetical protein
MEHEFMPEGSYIPRPVPVVDYNHYIEDSDRIVPGATLKTLLEIVRKNIELCDEYKIGITKNPESNRWEG